VNLLVVSGCAVAGAVAGVPLAAVAYGASPDRPIRLPARWWTGAPAGSWSLFAVMAISAGGAAVVSSIMQPNITLIAFWLFAVVGVALAVIDVRCRRLPHLLTGVLFATSLLCFTVDAMAGTEPSAIARAALSGLITAGVFLGIALASPGQLGLGDVTFAGAIAFNLGWLTWQAPLFAIASAWLMQGAGVLIARSLRLDGSATPLGPALMCGWLLTVALSR
jgi:leader peptidase (prepilin peptidase)/N-methyltransferase